MIATSSEMRPPCISRARTSRPTPSVPNQWLALGALLSAGDRSDWASRPTRADKSGSLRESRARITSPDKAARFVTKRPRARAVGPLRDPASSKLRHSSSGHLDAGIDSRIGDVGQEVDHDDAGADDSVAPMMTG